MLDSITPSQIASKQRIGKLGDLPVFQVDLKGGLHLVVKVDATAKKTRVLGAGPHPQLARHIASKDHKDLVLDAGLKKSELDPAVMRAMPIARAWTAQLRERFG